MALGYIQKDHTRSSLFSRFRRLNNFGGCLCISLAMSEDSGTEGLSSTSLADFIKMSHFKSLDSSEQTNLELSESDFGPGALQASPGSGFFSEEKEDSKVLQSQYLWEEGGDSNDSSVYMGPAADYSFPLASQRTLPKENGTHVKDPQGEPTFHPLSDSFDPDSEAPSTRVLEEEEEGLLPINQLKGMTQSSQMSKTTFSETPKEDSLYDILFSTMATRMGPATEATTNKHGKETALEYSSSGFDLGSSMGPNILPLSPIFSTETTTDPQLVSELPPKITQESTVAAIEIAGEQLATVAAVEGDLPEGKATTQEEIPKPVSGTVAAEMKLTGEDVIGSHQDNFQGTETVSRTPNSLSDHSSLHHFWDWTSRRAPTPTANQNSQDTELPIITTAAAEKSFTAQNRDLLLASGVPWSLTQIICKDWSNLAGKNYIILNMSDNIDCEEFRVERGLQLLALMEDAFSRYDNGLQGQWMISLSKPNENDKHLLMTLAGEHGVVPTNDVLLALGDVQKSLAEIGIQNYTTTSSCQSRPSQTHSDYGKLFVVLVIIGSICVIIIIMGLIYNCWQRRMPKMKNMSHGEELRFVENGCHDNPTLDVASDSHSEMQEKKPSVNGGGAVNGPESWDVLINKQTNEEGEAFEEDTHL
ncbi:podocalyxin-like protein 2 [Pseudonaja textilis]|uniref:podocalyxin-like protein 2 n=1 Tax=Pseudonaja textilis TaxID=8673 RepID=UPI000EA96C82|nr:podocalyxin-like protein 2 [Pseudonaja textilis]